MIFKAVNEDVLILGEAEAEASNMLVPNETPVQEAEDVEDEEAEDSDEVLNQNVIEDDEIYHEDEVLNQ